MSRKARYALQSPAEHVPPISRNALALIFQDVDEGFRLPSAIGPISTVRTEATMRFERLSVVNEGYVADVRC